MRLRLPALLTAIAVPLAAACRDLPGRRVESEHFSYRHRAGDEPCPELLPALEAHYAAVSGYLGVSLPPETRVRYFKFESTRDFEKNTPCSSGAAACVLVEDPPSVYSTRALHRHELAHAYLLPVGHPPALFEEGIADVLSCRYYPESNLIAEDAPLEEILETKAFRDYSGGAYSIAASFVRHLVDHYGISGFIALYGRLANDAKEDEIRETFQALYGQPLDDVVADWRATLPRPTWKARVCPAHCAAAGPALSPGMVEPIDIGPQCLETSLPFSVGARTDIELSLMADIVAVGLLPCAAGSGEQAVILDWVTNQGMAWVQLMPGSYFLRFDRGKAYRGSLRARSNVIVDRCADAAVQTIPPDLFDIRIFSSVVDAGDDHDNPTLPFAPDQTVRFQVDRPREIWNWSSHPAQITLCRDGCPGDPGVECTPLAPPNFPLDAGIPYALVVDADPSAIGYYRVGIWLTE